MYMNDTIIIFFMLPGLFLTLFREKEKKSQSKEKNVD